MESGTPSKTTFIIRLNRKFAAHVTLMHPMKLKENRHPNKLPPSKVRKRKKPLNCYN